MYKCHRFLSKTWLVNIQWDILEWSSMCFRWSLKIMVNNYFPAIRMCLWDLVGKQKGSLLWFLMEKSRMCRWGTCFKLYTVLELWLITSIFKCIFVFCECIPQDNISEETPAEHLQPASILANLTLGKLQYTGI